MTDTPIFDDYVRNRLNAWGRVFPMWDRYGPELGSGTHMLVRLIEHKGEIPPPNVGFKPLTVPPDEMEIEDIVREIHAELPDVAHVLRAVYGGWGRIGVERVRLAERLAGKPIKRRQLYALHDVGFHRVAGALMMSARAA